MNQRISRTGQIRVYLGKCFRLFVNEKQWKNFVSSFIIIVIICMVTSKDMFRTYADTRNGCFAVVSACIWIGLFNSIQSICRERAIIKREHRTGLHISSYILAHVIYEVVLCAGESLIVTLVMLIKNHSHLPDSGLIFSMAIDIYITLFFVTLGSDLIAMLVSCIVKNENTAMTVMPFVLIIQLVMSGTIFELSGITELISYITVSRWGLNGICSIACTNSIVDLQAAWANADGVDNKAGNLLMAWLVMLLFMIIYIAISIIALKQVDKDQR